METFNEDPKPGRLVLPLVLIGMIATTYTFINRVSTNNNLEIEPVIEEVTEITEPESTPEDTTTTMNQLHIRKQKMNLQNLLKMLSNLLLQCLNQGLPQHLRV